MTGVTRRRQADIGAGRIVGSAKIVSNSVVGNGSTTGTTPSEGTTPLRIEDVTLEEGRAYDCAFNCSAVLMDDSLVRAQLEFQYAEAGSGIWTAFYTKVSHNTSTTNGQFNMSDTFEVPELDGGDYDFRVMFNALNVAAVATILAQPAYPARLAIIDRGG